MARDCICGAGVPVGLRPTGRAVFAAAVAPLPMLLSRSCSCWYAILLICVAWHGCQQNMRW